MDLVTHTIKICMGSSCFSRGNGLNAELLERCIARGELRAELKAAEVCGTLCEGHCKEGPIVVIDGIMHKHVTPNLLHDLLVGEKRS